jgi:hypothetical protein
MAAYVGLKPHMDVVTHHTTVSGDFAMTRSQWLIKGTGRKRQADRGASPRHGGSSPNARRHLGVLYGSSLRRPIRTGRSKPRHTPNSPARYSQAVQATRRIRHARTRNARQHRRRALRRGGQPRARFLMVARVAVASSRIRALPPRWAWVPAAPSSARRPARAAERPAGGAGALCSPQGPRRPVPLLSRLSHIQICAAAACDSCR